MYYLIFILFAYLLFNHFLWIFISFFLLLIIFLFFKKENSFIFLFILGGIILFFYYFNNINFKYVNHNGKFINGDFLINDFSELKGDKKVVSAFPFEIFYKGDLNFYRGQVVEVAGYKYRNKIYAKEIVVKKEGHFIFRFFSKMRQKLYSRLEGNSDSTFKSLVKSFIFGDRNSLDFETKENFKITGLMHLLALSGLHIGIIAGFVSFFLSFLLRKSLVFYFVSLFLILYFFISGFSPSVFRAAFMFIVLYYYNFFESLNVEVFDVLLFTAFVSVVFYPEFLFNIGFWLSYFAFAGILFFSEFFDLVFQNLPVFIQKSFSTTLSANIVTFPLILYYFGSINIICFLSNLFVIPVFSIFLIFLFLAYLFSFVNVNFYFIPLLLWDLIKKIVEIFSYIPINIKLDDFNIFNFSVFFVIFILLFFSSKLIFYLRMKKIEKI